MAGATMAGSRRKASKPKRKASYATVNIKASDEWKAWLDGLAVYCRTDSSKLIDRALILLARAEGYDKEVPQR